MPTFWRTVMRDKKGKLTEAAIGRLDALKAAKAKRSKNRRRAERQRLTGKAQR